jgi:hypothetical protein
MKKKAWMLLALVALSFATPAFAGNVGENTDSGATIVSIEVTETWTAPDGTTYGHVVTTWDDGSVTETVEVLMFV